jgi:TolB-like protein/Tfp pilus assembly protein PilF
MIAAAAVAMAAAAAIYLWLSGASGPRTLAVLPFRPLSSETRDQYLELGMADAVITKLGGLRNLVVRPTGSVLKYVDSDPDAVAAGREMGVESVLDGSIQKSGDKVRVTVRLVRVSDGASLWAATFDESFTNIFAVQDSISERMADALALRMTGEERKLLSKRHTENTEAYQAYLKGRYYWGKWSGAGLQKAIEYFRQAVEIDPHYALAYSGLADCYSLLGYLNIRPPKEAFPKSEEAARKALDMDDALGEAYLSLAKVLLFYDWDGPRFETEMKRALDLNPNYPDTHSMYGTYLTAVGRFDDAVQARKRAQKLDPLSPFYTATVGWPYFYARQYDRAIEWYQKALELEPNFAQAHDDLATSYRMKGMSRGPGRNGSPRSDKLMLSLG